MIKSCSFSVHPKVRSFVKCLPVIVWTFSQCSTGTQDIIWVSVICSRIKHFCQYYIRSTKIYLLSGLTIFEVVLKVIFPALNSTRAWKDNIHDPNIWAAYDYLFHVQDHLALPSGCIVAKEGSPNSHDQLLSAGKRHVVSPKHLHPTKRAASQGRVHPITEGKPFKKVKKRGGREFCTITPKAQQVTSWDADWMPGARQLGHTLI